MNMKNLFFGKIAAQSQRGDMLVELLLSVALAAVLIPFVFRYQYNAVVRAKNASVVRQMGDVQSALERYIVDHRDDILMTVGRSIVRVEIADLVEFGLSPDIVSGDGHRYQLRVLKSDDVGGKSTLQGVVIMASGDISPMRTREIVSMGGGNMGFVDGTRVYGAFGAWHADVVDLGVNVADAIIDTTSVRRDGALYLYRVPSDNVDDATMMGPLNLGGHDIKNSVSVTANAIYSDEILHTDVAAIGNLIFQNRTTIDTAFNVQNATVAGTLSSDGRNMNIDDRLTLADVGKFTGFTTADLWASDMTLSGISISSSDDPAILKINQKLDMVSGRVDAMFVTVGFSGSITPRLNVKKRLEDSSNAAYYWDVASSTAHFNDLSFSELNLMAASAVHNETNHGTDAWRLFSAVAANKNATVSDFLNVISEIGSRVRTKYSLLNLE